MEALGDHSNRREGRKKGIRENEGIERICLVGSLMGCPMGHSLFDGTFDREVGTEEKETRGGMGDRTDGLGEEGGRRGVEEGPKGRTRMKGFLTF